MNTLKKHMKIFKINRQISLLNTELAHLSHPHPFLISGHFYDPNPRSSRLIRESEKSIVLREAVEELNARKTELRKS
jgi:hypothetical protein